MDDCLEAAELDEAKAPLFQSVDPAGRRLTGHASAKTTKLYDRTADTITVDEIERIVI